MVARKAIIRQGGFFKKGRVMLINILKDGSEGDSKTYVTGKVKVARFGGRYVLDFDAAGGTSMGSTSKGSVSVRAYTRHYSVTVDSYEFVED